MIRNRSFGGLEVGAMGYIFYDIIPVFYDIIPVFYDIITPVFYDIIIPVLYDIIIPMLFMTQPPLTKNTGHGPLPFFTLS